MLILLQLVLLSFGYVETSVVYPLQCPRYLGRFNIYLKVNASALPSSQLFDKNQLVLQATDLSTGKSFDSKCHREIECTWNLYKYSSGNYTLQLLHSISDRRVLWNYVNNSFQLPQDLFHCFDHNFGVFTHEVRDDDHYQVEWHTVRWDEYFKLIAYHNITLVETSPPSGHHVVMEHVPTEQCEAIEKGRKCVVKLANLKPCVQYKVCVKTVFKRSSDTFEQCMKSYLSTQNQECDHNTMPVYAVVIAALAISAVLLGVVGFLIKRRKQGSRNSVDQEIYDGGDVITPRAGYADVSDIWNSGDDPGYFVLVNTSPNAHGQSEDKSTHEQDLGNDELHGDIGVSQEV